MSSMTSQSSRSQHFNAFAFRFTNPLMYFDAALAPEAAADSVDDLVERVGSPSNTKRQHVDPRDELHLPLTSEAVDGMLW